jgi:threonine dehydrogenase-like Zn-dependent dehydrogenase
MERPSLPPLVAFVGREQAILGSFGMDRADIEDIFTLITTRRLDLSGSVSARFPLAETNEALQRLAGKDAAVVRVVVEP